MDAPPTVRLVKTDGCDGWAGIRSLKPAQVKQVKLTCCDPKCLAGKLPTCPIGAKRKHRVLAHIPGPGRGQPPSSPHPHTGHVPHALQQVQGQQSQPGQGFRGALHLGTEKAQGQLQGLRSRSSWSLLVVTSSGSASTLPCSEVGSWPASGCECREVSV